jgi:hypothetical protein
VSGGGLNTAYAYDGDGNLVKETVGGVVTIYMTAGGCYYQWQSGSPATATSYYILGGARVAMRTSPVGAGSTLVYLQSDHLGSIRSAETITGTLIAGSATAYWPCGDMAWGGAGLPGHRRFDGKRKDGCNVN